MSRLSDSSCFDEEAEDVPSHHNGNVSRRSLFHSAGLSFAGYASSGPFLSLFHKLGVNHHNPVANAVGLVQFPCPVGTLANTYYMMRAGESKLEAEDVLSTNPLFMTNREDALSDLGIVQVEEACDQMMARDINPSVVKYSLASKCIDTANMVATRMMVGRNRIVPEFTFMDPRGAGIWDGKPLASTEAAIWAMDADEAGERGLGGKPPPNDDGTANESLSEQVIRLRQLISIMETQYSGDTVLLIFPDGTSPALLSCLIADIPLNNVHALNYMPGEMREDVNMQNSRQLLKERMLSPTYNEMLSVGREELAKLREEEHAELLEKEAYTKPLLNKPKQKDSSISDKEFAMMRGPKLSLGKSSGEIVSERYKLEKTRRLSDLGDETATLGPNFFPVGAMGAAGYMATWKGDKDDDSTDGSIITTAAPEESKPHTPILAYANATGTMVFEQPTIGSLVPSLTSETTIRSAPPKTVMAATNVVVDANAGLVDPNLFEDVPVLSKQDRVDAAEKAMDDYMSQDDGGDGWLASMQDMMEEE